MGSGNNKDSGRSLVPSVHRFGPIFELLGKYINDSYYSISLDLPWQHKRRKMSPRFSLTIVRPWEYTRPCTPSGTVLGPSWGPRELTHGPKDSHSPLNWMGDQSYQAV